MTNVQGKSPPRAPQMCDFFLWQALSANTHFDGFLMMRECDADEERRRYEECTAAADECFPEGTGKAGAHLKGIFMQQICELHTCDHDIGSQSTSFLVGGGSGRAGGNSGGSLGNIAMNVVGGMALFIVVGIYISTYVQGRNARVRSDLRRIPGRDRGRGGGVAVELIRLQQRCMRWAWRKTSVVKKD